MPSGKQQKLDAYAQSLGYRSYFDYRNAVAKEQGYSSYRERRKAKQTGVGLKGVDAPIRTQSWADYPVYLPPPIASDTNPALEGPLQDLLAQIHAADRDIWAPVWRAYDIQLGPTENEVRRLTQQILPPLRDTQQSIKSFLESDTFANFWALGVESAGGQVSSQDMDRISEIRDQATRDLNRGTQLTGRSAMGLLAALQDVDSARNRRRIIRNDPIRAAVYSNGSRHGFKEVMSALLRASAVRMHNEGYLRASVDQGVQWFLITDGPECGLTEHRDPNLADGQIVDAEVAQTYPIAHPNCVRKFTARPDMEDGPEEGKMSRVKEMAKSALKDVIRESIKATAIETARTFIRQNDLDYKALDYAMTRVLPAVGAYSNRLRGISRTYDNVYDINTGRPLRFSPLTAARDLLSYGDEVAKDLPVPSHVKWILGLPMDALPMAVGDGFQRFGEFYDQTFRAVNSIPGDYFSGPLAGAFRDAAYRTALDSMSLRGGGGGGGRKPPPRGPGRWAYDVLSAKAEDDLFAGIGKRISPGDFLRFTFPDLRNRRTFRAKKNWSLADASVTYRPRKAAEPGTGPRGGGAKPAIPAGLLGRFNLNPHGLVRAGFGYDDLAKAFTPTFRLVPPGPLRVQTKINRAYGHIDEEGNRIGQGRVTSASTTITLIAPKGAMRRVNEWAGLTDQSSIAKLFGKLGMDLSVSLNNNLRQLGLYSFAQIRNLTLDDWKRLRDKTYFNSVTGDIEEYPIFRIVSLATRLRLQGGTLPDIQKTFRISWDTAKKIWSMSMLERVLWLEGAAADIAAAWQAQDPANARVYSIQEATHPYTYQQSFIRNNQPLSAWNMRQQGLEPMEDVPDNLQPGGTQ